MPVPPNSAVAIAERLLSETSLTPLVGNRITPNHPETDPEGDYIVFQKISGGEGFNLAESRRLKNYFYRVDIYADTDERAEVILAIVQTRLFGNPLAGIPPWRSLSDGVQGCFPLDDADADTLEDGGAANGQSLSIWFAPQA